MFSKHLLTFTSWIFSRNPLFYFFQDHLGLSCSQQAELASVHRELCEIHSFHLDAKSTNKNCQNVSMENLFQDDLYFTGTWTYPVRLPIPSMQLLRPAFWYKADNCNICIKIVIMSFCIEFQKPSSC